MPACKDMYLDMSVSVLNTWKYFHKAKLVSVLGQQSSNSPIFCLSKLKAPTVLLLRVAGNDAIVFLVLPLFRHTFFLKVHKFAEIRHNLGKRVRP
jgi:hypothetical protein